MKVFTLGLDEKEKQKAENAENDAAATKIPMEAPELARTPPPTNGPIILARGPPKRKYGFACGLVSWFICAFCVVLLCLAISEVAYHRQRDQAFLRLKWAELRQRMLGYELLSQQQEFDRMALEKNSQIQSLPLRNEKPEVEDQHLQAIKPVNEDEQQDQKLGFLQALMENIRKNAEKLGLSGDMQVHVVEVKPVGENDISDSEDNVQPMSQRAIDDGFGEVAMPRQFGPWPMPNNDYENERPFGWQFDRRSMRKGPSPLFPRYEDYEEPQMRITHHFDGENRNPQRVVTELFGENSPDMYRNLLNDDQQQNGWNQQPVEQPWSWNQPKPQPQRWWQPQQAEVFTNRWDNGINQHPQPIFPQFQQPSMAVPSLGNNEVQQPWYMSAGQPQQPSWNELDANNNGWKQQDMPFQPHPSASAFPSSEPIHWVDNSASRNPFERNDQFNAPMDVISDGQPETVQQNNEPIVESTAIASSQDDDASKVEKEAEKIISPDPQLESIDESKFLPIRSDEKTSLTNDDVDTASHLFQIDDPNIESKNHQPDRRTEMAASRKTSPLFHPLSRRLHLLLLCMFGVFCSMNMNVNFAISMTCMVNSTAIAMMHQSALNTTEDDLLGGLLEVSNETACGFVSADGATTRVLDYGGSLVWDQHVQNLLFSAAFWGGMVAVVPSIAIVQRLSPKYSFFWVIVVKAIVCFLTPYLALNHHYYAVFIARFFLGFGEVFVYPSINTIVTSWYPVDERSTAVAIFTTGNQLALFLGSPVAAAFCKSQWGWPAIFYFSGLISCVWCILWVPIASNTPDECKTMRRVERELLARTTAIRKPSSAIRKQPVPWGKVLTNPAFLAHLVATCAVTVLATVLMVYLPTYFKQVLMLGVMANGTFVSIPMFFNFAFKLIWGMTVDKLKERKILTPTQSVKISQCLPSFGTAISLTLIVLFVNCERPALALFLFVMVNVCIGAHTSGAYTSLLSLAPQLTASMSSISIAMSMIGQLMTPFIVGAFNTSGTKAEWNMVLIVVAGMSVVAGVVFTIFGSGVT
ncbi:unnamed protein product [Caenorhabditis auriculariae]|uniref:Major facilitator superfamily (MFS) profile domain-containing protein n=1 Tax=Caenorhabditis auriculariae TaxID=2777116 RepID=A0A8S1HJ09_9PELO|nr:unnamed protein product [Caenorhabditis auriculariae]